MPYRRESAPDPPFLATRALMQRGKAAEQKAGAEVPQTVAPISAGTPPTKQATMPARKTKGALRFHAQRGRNILTRTGRIA